jgi:hypothetical protein
MPPTRIPDFSPETPICFNCIDRSSVPSVQGALGGIGAELQGYSEESHTSYLRSFKLLAFLQAHGRYSYHIFEAISIIDEDFDVVVCGFG